MLSDVASASLRLGVCSCTARSGRPEATVIPTVTKQRRAGHSLGAASHTPAGPGPSSLLAAQGPCAAVCPACCETCSPGGCQLPHGSCSWHLSELGSQFLLLRTGQGNIPPGNRARCCSAVWTLCFSGHACVPADTSQIAPGCLERRSLSRNRFKTPAWPAGSYHCCLGFRSVVQSVAQRAPLVPSSTHSCPGMEPCARGGPGPGGPDMKLQPWELPAVISASNCRVTCGA